MTGKLINNWNLHHKLFQPPLIIRTVSVIVWLRRGKRLLQPPEKWTCSVMKWEFVKAWEATGKNTYNSHWITSVGKRNSKSHLATVHLYFYKWQKRLLKDSKLADPFALLPHQFSPPVSSGHWSFETCRSAFLSLLKLKSNIWHFNSSFLISKHTHLTLCYVENS